MTTLNIIGLCLYIPTVIYGLWAAITGRPAFQADYWIVSILMFSSIILLLKP